MKIRIIFYRAKFGDKKWLDDAISLWTGLFNWGTGPYSHVELWVPDMNTPMEWYGMRHFQGTCYTSTLRGTAKGVCKRPASEILKNPKRWDYCEIEVDNLSCYNIMISGAEQAVVWNSGYDMKAIASFFLPFRFGSRQKFICSEFVYLMLWYAHIFEDLTKSSLCPSPRRLSRWLTKRGYAIKPLTPNQE